jgi:hypothetical protein
LRAIDRISIVTALAGAGRCLMGADIRPGHFGNWEKSTHCARRSHATIDKTQKGEEPHNATGSASDASA